MHDWLSRMIIIFSRRKCKQAGNQIGRCWIWSYFGWFGSYLSSKTDIFLQILSIFILYHLLISVTLKFNEHRIHWVWLFCTSLIRFYFRSDKLYVRVATKTQRCNVCCALLWLFIVPFNPYLWIPNHKTWIGWQRRTRIFKSCLEIRIRVSLDDYHNPKRFIWREIPGSLDILNW